MTCAKLTPPGTESISNAGTVWLTDVVRHLVDNNVSASHTYTILVKRYSVGLGLNMRLGVKIITIIDLSLSCVGEYGSSVPAMVHSSMNIE